MKSTALPYNALHCTAVNALHCNEMHCSPLHCTDLHRAVIINKLFDNFLTSWLPKQTLLFLEPFSNKGARTWTGAWSGGGAGAGSGAWGDQEHELDGETKRWKGACNIIWLKRSETKSFLQDCMWACDVTFIECWAVVDVFNLGFPRGLCFWQVLEMMVHFIIQDTQRWNKTFMC